MIDFKIITTEKQLIENINKRFEEIEKKIDKHFYDLKRNILFEIGTALLLEAKK